MNETPHTCCRRCGTPLTAGVPGGFCARCFGSGLFNDEIEGLPFTRIGDYELIEEIGRGGMGLVYRARQVSLNRPAAVKLILTGPLASAVERQRFVGEAEAAAALDHPGIVAVFEAGEEDGQPFFAMQLVEGESLSARLADGARYAPRESAELIRRVAVAVQHAHERGFLHRDLKPGNILLDAAGAPHVTDFGLARRMDDESKLTLTGAAVGTPSYMAPEQTDTRQPPTTAVDVYSLGAILYEVLSGQPPFAARSLPELFIAIREKEPVSLSGADRAIDRDLDVICRKCLEKEPGRRYRSAQGLADDLQHWLSGEPITARPVGKAERLWRWCRRRPGIAGLAATAVMFFFTGLTGIVWQWQRANREAKSAVEALRRSEESLWQANWSEARARRISRERGQRTVALQSLKSAAAHHETIALRNEAIAAMALPDLSEPEWFFNIPPGGRFLIGHPESRRVLFLSAGETVMLHDPVSGADYPLGTMHWSAHACDPTLTAVLILGEKTASGCRAELWSARPGAVPEKRFECRDVTAGAFSPDGARVVLCRGDKRIEVREAASGATMAEAECPIPAVAMEVSPDGKLAALVSPSATAAEIWSLDPLARREVLPSLPGPIASMSWHPVDGSLWMGANDSVHLVRPALHRADELVRHEREGAHAEGHPSGLFGVSRSWDGVVRATAWGLPGDLLRTSGLSPDEFSADGRLLTVSSGLRVGVCQVTPLDVWRPMPARAEEDAATQAIEFSPDSRWLAVLSRDSAAVFDPESFALKSRISLQRGFGGGWTPEGDLLLCEETAGISRVTFTADQAGTLTPEKQVLLSLKSKEARLDGLRVSRDGQAILITAGASAAVYDLAGKSVRSILKDQPMLSSPAWSPDGRWVATGYWNNNKSGGAEATVFNPADGTVVQRFPAGSCRPVFTPDGKRLIIGSTNEYVEYETGTWRELRRHPREASGLDQGLIACSAAANLLVIQANETVLRLLRLDTGEELARLEPPSGQKLQGLALSPDGRWLACEARKVVRLWDLRLMRRTLRDLGLDWEN